MCLIDVHHFDDFMKLCNDLILNVIFISVFILQFMDSF